MLFSIRQLLHQLAQKSTKTTLPLRLDSLMVFPVGLYIDISGAMSPTAGFMTCCFAVMYTVLAKRTKTTITVLLERIL